MERLIEMIQGAGFTETQLAKLAATILNETTLGREAWIAFWATLDEAIQLELQSRIDDLLT